MKGPRDTVPQSNTSKESQAKLATRLVSVLDDSVRASVEINPEEAAKDFTPESISRLVTSMAQFKHIVERILELSTQVVAQEISKKFGDKIRVNNSCLRSDRNSGDPNDSERLSCNFSFPRHLDSKQVQEILDYIRPMFPNLKITFISPNPYSSTTPSEWKVLFKRGDTLKF